MLLVLNTRIEFLFPLYYKDFKERSGGHALSLFIYLGNTVRIAHFGLPTC